MGGSGSGTYYRWQGSKTPVESCLWIEANLWMREGILAAGVSRRGVCSWSDSRRGDNLGSIGYFVSADEDGTGRVELKYTSGKGDQAQRLRYTVRLQSTRPHLGGLRWWFTCPLIVGGRACDRRVGKLYLVGRYFGCRRCHNLTYRSCQEAHKDERLEAYVFRLARELSLGRG